MRIGLVFCGFVWAGAAAFTHWVFVGSTFHLASAATWTCLLAWPAIWFALALLIAFAVFLLFVTGLAIDSLWSRLPFVAKSRRRKFNLRFGL